MESRFSNSTEETEREGKCELDHTTAPGEGAVRDWGQGDMCTGTQMDTLWANAGETCFPSEWGKLRKEDGGTQWSPSASGPRTWRNGLPERVGRPAFNYMRHTNVL